MRAQLSMSAAADCLTHDTPETRIAAADWSVVEDNLGRDGFAVLPSLLTPALCEDSPAISFRRRVFVAAS